MITFKEEFISNEDTSIVLYKDEISIIHFLLEDFSLDLSKKKDQKMLITLFKEFFEHFLSEFLQVSSDIVADNLETLIEDVSTKDTKAKFIKILETSSVNLDEIFEKSYFEFKGENLSKNRIGITNDLNEQIDIVSDDTMEPTTSGAVGFIGIFFSNKYRYMSDYKVKREIVVGITVWAVKIIIGLVVGLIFTYIMLRFFTV